jgi:predicted ATP-grasp superfamily ATP-dependent carboligase
MRLLIYEWCCSGGLLGPDRSRVIGLGDDAASLAREGHAMFRSLVVDAVRDGGFEVAALVDETAAAGMPAAARRIPVPPGREVESLTAAAKDHEATIVVAPETAGVLASRVTAVRGAGASVIGPSDAFIRLAADKQATIDALAAAGVPVPAGRSLAANESWPEWFRLPAVRKARASTGGDGLVVVEAMESIPSPAPVAARLEACCSGEPVGVSCLLGPRGIVPLAVMRQRFTAAPSPAYEGGAPLDDPARRSRAEGLAVRAIAALCRRDHDPSTGWVGVDMILGDRDDGLDDRVLEVNPRITTSFVGFTAAASASLVRAIVDVAAGRDVDRGSLPKACRFSFADDTPPTTT